ncbi:Hsp70 family protein [Actinokineospora sp. G85]|uniref:Hsp70 family protein n=1 Tax=Actinokineospora sp. G85 TaxID=3406626 RepID=UPI003C724266
MNRESIDFGIDLGTTTSIIAVATAAESTVIRNNRQSETTQSAVYVNRSGKIMVGQAAKDRVEIDPDNACAEFKLRMGAQDERKLFAASGRTMTPEEMSAEVLKSLRGDVAQALGENIDAAVITVPAAFELDQCDATRRAAALAGLRTAPLIQEPSAAAWAYSAHLSVERGFWLVYDFGGGTFDAAVVKIADEEFSTVNHAGDNFLGGKLIDWALVDDVLVPAAREQGPLPGLARGDQRSAGNIAKLKAAAENAKVELSRTETVDLLIPLTLPDGGSLIFEFELTRAHVERAAMPLYRRSIALCRNAIAEAGVAAGQIERVLLVGGATLAPALRELLADPDEGLGIALEHSLDPVTVVARGAAIFAGTQRAPAPASGQRPALADGVVRLELEYDPAGSDTEPLVGGLPPTGGPADWTGATIEFVLREGQPPWRSGQVPLTAEGTFSTRLTADERTVNSYEIELRDPDGNLLPTEPARFSYRHTPMMGTAPTLSHSIGVGLTDNTVLWLVRKGSELPAKARAVLHSTQAVRRDASTGLIRVPLVEGERGKADLNMLVGQLDLSAAQVRRDVPAGSEVEVSVTIDTSFTPRADAFIPLLDEEFAIDITLGRTLAATDFPGAADDVAERLDEVEQRLAALPPADAAAISGQVGRFRRDTLAELRRVAAAATSDPDAAATADNRLRDAHDALDAIDADLDFPERLGKARELHAAVTEAVEQANAARHRAAAHNCGRAIEAAARTRDALALEQQRQILLELFRQILDETGELDVVIFLEYSRGLADDPNPRIRQLLQNGQRAMETGDAQGLAAVNSQLRKAAPHVTESAAPAGKLDSTVQAGDR